MKTLIAVPAMDMVHTRFMMSLIGMRRPGETAIGNTQSTVIHIARDLLVKQAMELRCDRILWLDSDMNFRADLMERLAADMDEGREMVTALYFGRRPPIVPILFKDIQYDGEAGVPEVYSDYPQDSVFPVAGCGFGAVMMTTRLVSNVMSKFTHPFQPIPGLGEDIAFCWRVAQVGGEIYCDSRIKPYHIGMYDYSEADYMGQGLL